MPRAETIGELRELIKDIPADVRITNVCDHAGVTTMYIGIQVGPNIRGIMKSRYGGYVPVTKDLTLDDSEKEFDAINIG
jgi:hypothetical protein